MDNSNDDTRDRNKGNSIRAKTKVEELFSIFHGIKFLRLLGVHMENRVPTYWRSEGYLKKMSERPIGKNRRELV